MDYRIWTWKYLDYELIYLICLERSLRTSLICVYHRLNKLFVSLRFKYFQQKSRASIRKIVGRRLGFIMGDGIFLNSLYTIDRRVLTLCNGHPIFFQIFAQVKMLVVENAFVSVFQLISPFTIYIHKFESYRHPKNAGCFVTKMLVPACIITRFVLISKLCILIYQKAKT